MIYLEISKILKYYRLMNPNDLRKILKEELQPLINSQDELQKSQDGILKTLTKHSKKLDQHSEKLDSITAELGHVHQLADVTLDVVTARYESNKREIDEIKDHLNLPKKPYFGKID